MNVGALGNLDINYAIWFEEAYTSGNGSCPSVSLKAYTIQLQKWQPHFLRYMTTVLDIKPFTLTIVSPPTRKFLYAVLSHENLSVISPFEIPIRTKQSSQDCSVVEFLPDLLGQGLFDPTGHILTTTNSLPNRCQFLRHAYYTCICVSGICMYVLANRADVR